MDYTDKQTNLEENMHLNTEKLNIGWYRNTHGQVPSVHIKHYLLAKEYGGLSGQNPWANDETLSDSTQVTSPTYEQKQYYYHPDHLGSSNYLTDVLGETYQHLEYLPWGETFLEERNTQTDRNSYLYTGKELDALTGLYYYEQRYYDANKSTFLGVDPLAEKYANVGGYVYCLNNPMRFVDIWGLEPTDEEAAAIADHIYKGKVGDKIAGGWTLEKVHEPDDNPGYRSGIYKREKKNGDDEYVMANAGTDDLHDIKEDVLQPFGGSDHMWTSIRNAQELDAELGKDVELTFVGHSKGGAEAAGNALATNRNAKIFNTASINAKAYGLDVKKYTGNMTAFVVTGDILHSKLNWWSSRPIDKIVFLPRQHGSLFDREPVRFFNQGRNHMMSSVINALKQYNK